jgi:hypothetical protein
MKKLANNVAHYYPPEQGVTMDVEAFDNAIRSQGVPMIHFRAMKCPIGLKDRDEHRRPCEDHKNCSNGHIYTPVGRATCLFTGNTEILKYEDFGALDDSRAMVTAPRFYDGTTERIRATTMDRFYYDDPTILVEHQQYFERSLTGLDKLSFPVQEVLALVDSSDNWYTADTHFDLVNGRISWKSGMGPAIDPTTGRGAVYSVRYLYTPYFYVERVMHQVRVSQVETVVERVSVQMPQQYMLAREFVFESEKRDPDAVVQDSPRQSIEPRPGAPGANYQMFRPGKGTFSR